MILCACPKNYTVIHFDEAESAASAAEMMEQQQQRNMWNKCAVDSQFTNTKHSATKQQTQAGKMTKREWLKKK